MSSEEVSDSLRNEWGWSSIINSAINYLPAYNLAHRSDLPIGDGFGVIVLLSYQIYSKP